MRTLLPFFAKKIAPEGGGTLTGALETTYGIGQIIGATFLGRISDTHGRKVVLLMSFVGSAIGYAMTAAATTPLVLIISRLPVGLAKQTVAASRAILADCVPREELSGMMSKLTSLFAVGYAIGPMLGGYISEQHGDEKPALATCFLFLALIPTTLYLLPETNARVTKGPARSVEKEQEGKRGEEDLSREHLGGIETGKSGVEGHRRRMMGLVLLLMMPEFAVVR